ncbi:MAG: hypothetical protein AAB217_18660 [Chloroflexota bacterium]
MGIIVLRHCYKHPPAVVSFQSKNCPACAKENAAQPNPCAKCEKANELNALRGLAHNVAALAGGNEADAAIAELGRFIGYPGY